MNESEVIRALQRRALAKAAKDWSQCDQIRAELAAAGHRVDDHPDGTSSLRNGLAPRVANVNEAYLNQTIETLRQREKDYSRRISDLVTENLALKYGKKSPV